MMLCGSPNAPAHDEAAWRRDCIRRDWPSLAAAAERLLADRRQRDPASVEASRLTEAEARARELTMASVVAIWRAVVRHEALPELTASHAATRADLEGAAAACARIAQSRPGDQGSADHAMRVAALAGYHRAVAPDGTPMIIAVHLFNQHWRHLRACRPTIAKPTAIPPAEAAAPRRAPSRGPRSQEPQQKGLF